MPCVAELGVSETVSDIKRAIQLPEPEPQQAMTLTPGMSAS
jgi:hypothetical protein